ncbi:MAG: zf-HC2 domain-containing protein [Planctomycetota bacterium]|jgi:hypothetical protein
MPGVCPEPEWYSAYAEGRLSEADEAWLRRHASRCEDCRREMALVCSRDSGEPPEAVPEIVQTRVRTAVLRYIERTRATRHFRTRRQTRTGFARTALAAAAVLAIAVALTFILIEKLRPAGPEDPTANEKLEAPTPPEEVVKRKAPESPDDEREIAKTPAEEEKKVKDSAPTPVPEPEKKDEELAGTRKEAEPKKEAPEEREPAGKTFAKVLAAHGPLRITDPSGDLTLRRKGQDEAELVTHPVELSEGDVLTARGPSAFYVNGRHAVVLEENTELTVTHANVDDEEGSWLALHTGRATVSSEGEYWWLSDSRRTVAIESAHSLFSVASKENALEVTPIKGDLACRNEEGQAFHVPQGQSAVFDGTGRSVKPTPPEERWKLEEKYDSTLPKRKTLIESMFDYNKRAKDPVVVGKDCKYEREKIGRGYNDFIRGDYRGRAANVKLEFRTLRLPIGRKLTIRFRCRTNARKILVRAPVNDKPGELQHWIELERLGEWTTAEFKPDQFTLYYKRSKLLKITSEDIYSRFHLEARTDDVPGKARPYLLVDDFQIFITGE